MKRNLRKALAFSLAVVTVVATFLGVAPVKAAEYGEAKNVLEAKYDRYFFMGDDVYFETKVDVNEKNSEGNEVTRRYVDELVSVDKSGNVTKINVKNADNTYKYMYTSVAMNGTSLCLIRSDYTYEIYNGEDGTWFGNGANKYDDIYIMDDGNYLVSKDGTSNIVDAKENIIVKDVFPKIDVTAEDYSYHYHWVTTYGDYIVIERTLSKSVEGDSVTSYTSKVFDKNYKEVTTVDLSDKSITYICDNLVAFTDSKIEMYGPDLKAIECKIDLTEQIEAGATIQYVYEGYNWATKKEMITVRLYTPPAEGEQWGTYTHLYFDAQTHAQIQESDIQYYPMDDANSIEGTNVTIKFDNQVGSQYYNGETLLFTDADILAYFREYYSTEDAKVAENGVSAQVNRFAVCKDFFIDYSVTMPDGSLVQGVAIVTDETGYKLDKVTVVKPIEGSTIPVGLNGVAAYPTIGIAYFQDGRMYANNTFYNEGEFKLTSYKYDEETSDYVPYGYLVRTGKEDAYTWSYYNLDGALVYASTKEIYVARDGFVVYVDGEDTSEKYGCVVIPKVLDSIEDVVDEVENAKPGDKIEVALKENASLPADVLTNIKGEDITLVIETPDAGVTWTINGKDITGADLKDIDLSVKKVENVIPAAAIGAIEMDSDAKVEISLGHNGEFGFSAKLEVNVDKANAGKYANRFYYNPETKALEFKETVKVDENGNAVFTFTHASDYVVLISDTSYEILQAGDNALGYIGVIALIGVAFVAVAVSFKRKVRA